MNDHLALKGHLLVEKYDRRGRFMGREEAHNIFLTTGINELWKLATGQSANTFTNAQATIGIGDSATAASAGQTDLQAATNKLYKATVTLTGLETWASNDMVAAKFSELGFKKPRVTGSGGVRQGEALWPGQEKSVPLPIDPHLSNVAEVA